MKCWIVLTEQKAKTHPKYGIKGIAALLRVILIIIPLIGLVSALGGLANIIHVRNLNNIDYILILPNVIFFIWSGWNAILLEKHKSTFIRSFFTFLALAPIISSCAIMIWVLNTQASLNIGDFSIQLLSIFLFWALWASIWIPYVLFSARINVTILNRVRNSDKLAIDNARI